MGCISCAAVLAARISTVVDMDLVTMGELSKGM